LTLRIELFKPLEVRSRGPFSPLFASGREEECVSLKFEQGENIIIIEFETEGLLYPQVSTKAGQEKGGSRGLQGDVVYLS
jgi:hypothetical protein